MLRSTLRRFKAGPGDGDAESVRSVRKDDTGSTASPLPTIKKSASANSCEDQPTPTRPVSIRKQGKKKNRSLRPENVASNAGGDDAHNIPRSSKRGERSRSPGHETDTPAGKPISTRKQQQQQQSSSGEEKEQKLSGWKIIAADENGEQKLINNEHHQKDKERKVKKKKKTKLKDGSKGGQNELNSSNSSHHPHPEQVKHQHLVSPKASKASKGEQVSPKRGGGVANNFFKVLRENSKRSLFGRDNSKRSISSARSARSKGSESEGPSSSRSLATTEDERASSSNRQHSFGLLHSPNASSHNDPRQGTVSAGAYANVWLKDMSIPRSSSASECTNEVGDYEDEVDNGDHDDMDEPEEAQIKSFKKSTPLPFQDKRNALMSKKNADVGHSEFSLYIEDGSEKDGDDEPQQHSVSGSDGDIDDTTNSVANKKKSALDGSSSDNRDDETSTNNLARLEVARLKKDNAKLSNKLEWVESEVEKLKKERRAEKVKLKDVTSKLDQVEKDYAKAVEELARQEEAIMDKDMQIMALEENRNKGNDHTGIIQSSEHQIKQVDGVREMQDDCSELSGDEDVVEEKRKLRISTIRNARVAEQEMEEVAAKDQEILELKRQLQCLKEESNPNRKPFDDLVGENKALRKEIAAMREKEREYSVVTGAAVAAPGAVVQKANGGEVDIQSGDTNKNLAQNNSYDDDEILDEFEIQELHQQLKAQGIPPTLQVTLENSFDNRTSTLSMGERSYINDLENQLANKEHEQEEELLDEAREMYQVALEEKGVPGSRELLLFIYTELLEDTKEERREERKQLALKLNEARKKIAEEEKEKKEGDLNDDGEIPAENMDADMMHVLTDIRDDIGNRKSFNYNAMMEEINKANNEGDNLKKELEYTQILLKEKEKEIEEMKVATSSNRRLSSSSEKLRAVMAEKDTTTQQLKDELLEVLEKLDRKDESIAFMQQQLVQSGQKSDQYEKLKEQEKEINKYRQLAEDRANDMAVIKLEIEELREELGHKSSDKNYFKSKTATSEEDSSVNARRGLSQMLFKWGDTTAKDPPKLDPSTEPNHDAEDDDGPSKIMGSFVKNYWGGAGPKAPP